MSNLNSITVSGNLGRDPELKYLANDKKVTKSSIAVALYSPDAKRTMWLDVEIWGAQAEAFKNYCSKGDRITVSGSLDVDVWTDRNNVEQKSFKVKANKIEWPYKENHQTPQQQQEAVINF